VKNSYPVVVDDVLKVASIGLVQRILKELLTEKIPIKDMLTILETISDVAEVTKSVDIINEQVRARLARVITNQYKDEQGVLKLVTLAAPTEQKLLEHLQERNMIESIQDFARSGKPILGICLGMQLLFESSEEFGEHAGLGLIKGKVEKFDASKFSEALKIPHMGWNRVFTKEHPLFKGLDENHYLYFVHTFHVHCKNEEDIIGETDYGYRFTSAVAHENIMGIQPHPEKNESRFRLRRGIN